ncbi:MAG: site-specific integrase [Rhodospirillaceae bacterium]|nr:site-specific integrase [Rhodospirillaceae bacterium]
MSDIRRREGAKGVTYQVRFPSSATKTGCAYKTFRTMKEARTFRESGQASGAAAADDQGIRTMKQAASLWLRVCEKEGLNGREPVTHYTLHNYRYRVEILTSYDWPGRVQELTAPDIVAFRSWLLSGGLSRDLARKVLATLHSVLKEMTIRGVVPHNVASGISVRADSRYAEPVRIPNKAEIVALLGAADKLANSRNAQIARTWERYRPILYLAVDSGMRPQEYLAVAKSGIDASGVQVNRAIDGSGASLTVPKTAAGRRHIDLSAQVLDMVNHYASHHMVPNDFDLVFPARNGRWLCRKNWQRRGFNAACEEAGLVETVENAGKQVEQVKYRPYDLRHFFASMLIERGTNLKRVQYLMGHSNIETTLNVYGHLLEDDARIEGSDRELLTIL